MDELELACAAVVNIAEKSPERGCSNDDLKLFGLRKSLDLRYAIADLATVLRARLAPRFSPEAVARNGSAVPAVISSPVATKHYMEKLAATATVEIPELVDETVYFAPL